MATQWSATSAQRKTTKAAGSRSAWTTPSIHCPSDLLTPTIPSFGIRKKWPPDSNARPRARAWSTAVNWSICSLRNRTERHALGWSARNKLPIENSALPSRQEQSSLSTSSSRRQWPSLSAMMTAPTLTGSNRSSSSSMRAGMVRFQPVAPQEKLLPGPSWLSRTRMELTSSWTEHRAFLALKLSPLQHLATASQTVERCTSSSANETSQCRQVSALLLVYKAQLKAWLQCSGHTDTPSFINSSYQSNTILIFLHLILPMGFWGFGVLGFWAD